MGKQELAAFESLCFISRVFFVDLYCWHGLLTLVFDFFQGSHLRLVDAADVRHRVASLLTWL